LGVLIILFFSPFGVIFLELRDLFLLVFGF
jgi:hypothetical protein